MPHACMRQGCFRAILALSLFIVSMARSGAEEALSLCLAHEKVGISVGEQFIPLERERVADHTLTLRGMLNGDLQGFGAAVTPIRERPGEPAGLEGLAKPLEQAETGGATMLLAMRLDAREMRLSNPYLRGDQYPLRTVRLLLQGWVVDVAGGDVMSEFSVSRSYAANSTDDAVAELTRNDFADSLARALQQACEGRRSIPRPVPAEPAPIINSPAIIMAGGKSSHVTPTPAKRPSQPAAGIPKILMPASTAERRVALVIGNDDYQHFPTLGKAVADARAFRDELKSRGFLMVYKENADRRQFNEAIDDFVGKLSTDAVAVIYYAGHGVQRESANYMLPVDLRTSRDIQHDGIDLGGLLDHVSEIGGKFTLAIIDACREKPKSDADPAPKTRDIGITGGLAPMTHGTGLMVLYSAGSNQRALDSLGERDADPNGLFMREFLQVMRKPGLSIQDVVKDVRINVAAKAKAVNYNQMPALYDESIGELVLTPVPPAH